MVKEPLPDSYRKSKIFFHKKDTLKALFEINAGQQQIRNRTDVGRCGMTNAQIHILRCHILVRHPRALQNVQHLPHVPIGQFHQSLFAIVRNSQSEISKWQLARR